MRPALALLLSLATGCRAGGERVEAAPGSSSPQRIVSLAPHLTDVLFRLGLGARVVGVTRYCDFPPAAKALPKVGGFADPNLEAILALRPDLVVAVESPASAGVLDRLDRLGVRTVRVRHGDLAHTLDALVAVGEAVGTSARAKALVAGLRAEMRRLSAAVAGRPTPRVLFVYGHRPLVAAGPGSFGDELIRRAGGRNALAKSRLDYPKLGVEEVLRLAPEVIIDASMGPGRPGDVSAFWGEWPEIPAVAGGRVYRADQPGLLQPGPRVAEGLAWLVKTLHPEVAP